MEAVILFILILASLAATAWRARRIAAVILGSKKDADFKLSPVGPRLRAFVWKVLLQGRVIQERFWPGLAHAFVFWGFLAFALVSIDHVAAGFGLDPIPRHSAFGSVYYPVVAVFALAVAIAIAGLAVRRFIARPKWLGEGSPESGFIAFLIFTLMATYLADIWFDAGRVNWWLHTLCLLIFLPLIPHTKHLHLALSPLTVFAGRGGFSKIPPLVGDEDFGLDAGADVTRLSALQAYTCVECGRCTEHCPANNTGKILSPKQIVLGLRDYLNENGAGGEVPLLGKHLSQEAAFQCTTCGACEYQCPVGIEHLPLIIGLRRGAVNTGKWEDDHGAKLFLNLEHHGNPLGLASSERTKFLKANDLPIYDGSQEYCLWLGCMGAYDPDGREIVLALVKLLRHLGVTFGVLKREKCTGDAARRLGNDLAFEELATYNLEQLKKHKVNKLLSICPHCVRTISEDWREFGEAPPIEHHSQFLARYRSRLPASLLGGDAVFHDPCYLGRYRDVYDEPRAVLGQYATTVEADRSRERSFCCGAGGGLVFLGEETGKRVSVERAEQLASTGASTVAAACPFCHTMFRDAFGGMEGAPRLLDVAQIAASSLTEKAR